MPHDAHGTGAPGAVALRVGRAEEGEERRPERGGQVNRAGVAADDQSGAAGERDEAPNTARTAVSVTGDHVCGSVAGGDHGEGDRIGLVRGVDQHRQTLTADRDSKCTEAVRRPLLCAPAGGGGKQGEAPVRCKRGDRPVGPALGFGDLGQIQVAGGFEREPQRMTQRLAQQSRALFDDVAANAGQPPVVEPAGRALAWIGVAGKAPRGGETAQDSGAQGTLHVDCGAVLGLPKFPA